MCRGNITEASQLSCMISSRLISPQWWRPLLSLCSPRKNLSVSSSMEVFMHEQCCRNLGSLCEICVHRSQNLSDLRVHMLSTLGDISSNLSSHHTFYSCHLFLLHSCWPAVLYCTKNIAMGAIIFIWLSQLHPLYPGHPIPSLIIESRVTEYPELEVIHNDHWVKFLAHTQDHPKIKSYA